MSKRGRNKQCSCCYCCKNSSQISFGFESCGHLALTSQTYLYSPLHLSNYQHRSTGSCLSHDDPLRFWVTQKKGKLTGGWKEITAILEFDLCVQKVAISGCCILYISPQNRRTRPQCTWSDNSGKETTQPQYWVNTSQGLPREGSGENTHSKQTLSGFEGQYSITLVMQSRYLTEPYGQAYCPHWGMATAFTGSRQDTTNFSSTYSPGTQWRMLGKMLFIIYRLQADGDRTWKELIPWFLFLCGRRWGCSKGHHLQRQGIQRTCVS